MGPHCWSLKPSAGLARRPSPLRRVCAGSMGRKEGCCGFQTGWPTSFLSGGEAAALPGNLRSGFSLDKRLVTETSVLIWRRGVKGTSRLTGHTRMPYFQRKSQDHHTHAILQRQSKDQNVISSEISSPVSLVWGGRARLVICKQLGFFPLQVY